MPGNTTSKRPSRLLNLNKAQSSTRLVSRSNARHSPLLSLPPEIRSRIWDYVLHVGVIHITNERPQGPCLNAFEYDLSVCQCPDVYEGRPPRVRFDPVNNSEHLKDTAVYRSSTRHHADCMWDIDTRKPLRENLNLDLLRTCRQVYQEAVLIPFSTNEFESIARHWGGANAFLVLISALIPAQLKAIRRLCLTSVNCEFPRINAVLPFKGLEHLSIRMVFSKRMPWHLDKFIRQQGVVALIELPLKSLNVCMEVQSREVRLTPTTIARLVAWQEDLETKTLNPAPDIVPE